ncbi:MAG: phosphoribosyl-AMP cyclohydrolase [Nitrososphaerota archaeon]
MNEIKINELDFKKNNGLIPVIVQDFKTRKVLMLAYMNETALRKTLETGYAFYWSRSRKKIWMKGETSGNIQKVKRIFADCDNDAILLIVEQIGNACHKNKKSCFHNKISEANFFEEKINKEFLERVIEYYKNAYIVKMPWAGKDKDKKYMYVVNPITEHIPPPEPEILEWIAEIIDKITPNDFDKVLTIEALGIPIATLVANRKGKPLAIVRKRAFHESNMEIPSIEYTSGFESGRYYLYGIKKGESVLLIDDMVSTGGTLIALIKLLTNLRIKIVDVVCAIEKPDYGGSEAVKKEAGISIKTIFQVFIKNGKAYARLNPMIEKLI